MAPSAGAYLYWANSTLNAIQRAELNGSEARVLIPASSGGDGIAVDDEHIYWTTGAGISRADLDGSDVEVDIVSGISETGGIAVNGEHIFWTSLFNHRLGRANLDIAR